MEDLNKRIIRIERILNIMLNDERIYKAVGINYGSELRRLGEELGSDLWGYDPEEDSEDYNEISDQLEILVELKEARIRLQEIERIAREAFNNPETQDINLYRAQALANIYAIFEYDGATIKREEA